MHSQCTSSTDVMEALQAMVEEDSDRRPDQEAAAVVVQGALRRNRRICYWTAVWLHAPQRQVPAQRVVVVPQTVLALQRAHPPTRALHVRHVPRTPCASRAPPRVPCAVPCVAPQSRRRVRRRAQLLLTPTARQLQN